MDLQLTFKHFNVSKSKSIILSGISRALNDTEQLYVLFCIPHFHLQ